MNPDEAEDLRSEVMGVLRSASCPKPNRTKNESQALSELKSNPSIIMFLPANKGRATVVLEKRIMKRNYYVLPLYRVKKWKKN